MLHRCPPPLPVTAGVLSCLSCTPSRYHLAATALADPVASLPSPPLSPLHLSSLIMLAPSREVRSYHRSSLSNFEDLKTIQDAKSQADPSSSSSSSTTTFRDQARASRSARSGTQPHHPPHPSHHLHPLAFAPTTTRSHPHPSSRTTERLVPSSWNPVFLDKPHAYIRHLIQHPHVFPVCTLHLAAIRLQRWWRSLPDARRRKRSTRRLETLPSWQHPWERLKQLPPPPPPLPTPPPLHPPRSAHESNPSTSSAVLHWTTPTTSAVSFRDHCASVIQRAWRAHRARRHSTYIKRRMYRTAARSLQDWWRAVLKGKEQRRQDQQWAARVIQRAFRAHVDRRIYHFFRHLIRLRTHTSPASLLHALAPGDSLVADPAQGLYVRLRLAGPVWPPVLLYKVYTRTAVVDVGSFAPRDYYEDGRRQGKGGRGGGGGEDGGGGTDVSRWYVRWENNGWRVVGGPMLLEMGGGEGGGGGGGRVWGGADEKGLSGGDGGGKRGGRYHHPNRVVRKVEAERRRKERRVQWLKKMYREGEQGKREEGKGEEGDGETKLDLFTLTLRMDELIGQGKEEREAAQEEAEARGEREKGKGNRKGGRGTGGPEEKEGGGGGWEEDVDALVDWAAELRFDDYQRGWAQTGVTSTAG